MPSGPINSVMQQIRKSVLQHDENALTDRQLLERFASSHEEFAFETLVLRHGQMVLGVCRRVLGNVQDAEDAFQATFLVLARKAASIGAPELLGNWLYGTAYRTAQKVKTQRRVREQQVHDMPHPIVEPNRDCDEMLSVLDRELSRLPDKYRVPVVLCELEGKSRKEVARKLRVPEGTLSSRLATARKMLAKRLAGRGLALPGGTLAAALSQNAASACLPNALVSSTVQAAACIAAGKVAVGVVSGTVAALTEGVLKAMFLTKLKIGTALVLAVMFCAGGARMLTYFTVAAQPAELSKQPSSKVVEPPERADAKPEPPAQHETKKAKKPEWGEPVNGIQARIRSAKFDSNLLGRDAERLKWGVDETPKFALDLRNQGKKDYAGPRVDACCEIEFDGKWYRPEHNVINAKSSFLDSGKEFDGWVTVSLTDSWILKDDKEVKLRISPGQHTIRIAYVDLFEIGVEGLKTSTHVISNLVEFEVLKEKGWGEAVEGVQTRLGPEKVEWPAGETPKFGLDLRNRGQKTFTEPRLAAFCEIEVDGKWFVYGEFIDIDMPVSSFKPGEQIDDWVRVSLDGSWVDKTAKHKQGDPIDDKVRLKVAPGKHTVRVAFPLSDKVRPISQVVEIVVLPASTPAAPAKEGAEADKKSGTDAKFSAPAWGKPQNGLRIGICQSEPKWWADGKWRFMAVLENTGAKDVVLRLGDMLGNGQKQVPTALRLTFTDAGGKKRIWQAKLGRIAGRVDPLVVPLGAGCRYVLPLNDFDDEDPARLGVPIALGKHRVAVEFVGKAVRKEETNEDVRGFALMRYWTGTVSSAEVAISYIGDWAQYHMTNTKDTTTTTTTIWMTVVAKDDKEMTYEVVSNAFTPKVTEIMGLKIDGALSSTNEKHKIDRTKPYDPIAAVIRDLLKQSDVKIEKQSDKNKEKLKVGDKEYDTTWTQMKITSTDNDSTIVNVCRMWFSKDVPLSGLVKMETTTITATLTTTTKWELTGTGTGQH